MKKILFYSIDPKLSKPEVAYVFDFIFRTIGVKAKYVELNSTIPIDLYYGNDDIKSALIIRQNEGRVITNVKDIQRINKDGIAIIGDDVINSIGFYLIDKCNKYEDAERFDKHERLLFEKSFQYVNSIYEFPIVNMLVDFVESVIKQMFPDIIIIPKWPEGKQAAIVLSHDVEYPQKYAFLKNGFKEKKSIKDYLRYINMYRRYLLDKNKNEFWLFEKIMKEEAKYGFKSTWFFAAVNKYEKGASVLDIEYDIAAVEFKSAFALIKKYDCEIGLHASYNAYLSTQHFSDEKKKLEALADTDVLGLRHHYWHLGKNIAATLAMHGKANFKYDSSLAFNGNIGFRYNTALPFYPYNKETGAGISCLQLPTFCMDMSLFNKESITIGDAMEAISGYINTITEVNGIGAIDWHDCYSFPSIQYEKYGNAYIELLKVLHTNYKNVWVTSFKEIYNWIELRNKKTATITE